MNHGSLFSGIGGFDLAAEWMGWENKFHCEINEFCQRVLKYYWPDAKTYGDITKTDFTIWKGRIDVLTGGFPCQPYSTAGKRKGKEDERHLWPQMLRAITEIQPRWILGENVLGLVNWSGGLVFHEVQADLEAAGYEVWPYVLPACGKNAPHRRDRVWFVAHAVGNGHGYEFGKGGRKAQKEQGKKQREEWDKKNREWDGGNIERINDAQTTPNTGLQRPPFTEKQAAGIEQCDIWDVTNTFGLGSSREKHWQKKSRFNPEKNQGCWWQDFPTQPPVCSRNDELSGKLDGITFSKWRNESIKAYGNAVVYAVVYEIFKAIEQYEKIKQWKRQYLKEIN